MPTNGGKSKALWIEFVPAPRSSGSPDPDIPPKHLIAYFMVVDGDHVLLVDHKTSGLLATAGRACRPEGTSARHRPAGGGRRAVDGNRVRTVGTGDVDDDGDGRPCRTPHGCRSVVRDTPRRPARHARLLPRRVQPAFDGSAATRFPKRAWNRTWRGLFASISEIGASNGTEGRLRIPRRFDLRKSHNVYYGKFVLMLSRRFVRSPVPRR